MTVAKLIVMFVGVFLTLVFFGTYFSGSRSEPPTTNSMNFLAQVPAAVDINDVSYLDGVSPIIVVTPSPTPEPTPPPTPEPAPVPPPPRPQYVASLGGFGWPILGSISTYFGEWSLAGVHQGIDIVGGLGSPVAAAAAGIVVSVAWDAQGYGNYIVIQHPDGFRTLYGHLSEVWVGVGQIVDRGEGIGTVGLTGLTTGPHLHFELWIGGVPTNPLAYLV